jgi:hypothetical protein
MFRISAIIFFILFILSCNKNGLNDCTKDRYNYAFLKLSKIDTSSSNSPFQGYLQYQINAGNDLVFKYTHEGPDCKNIADEEFTEFLVFQVPAGTNSFNYQNAQLESANCYFNLICFCDINARPVKSGSIKGNKISESRWNVEINIDVPGSANKIILNKIFVSP